MIPPDPAVRAHVDAHGRTTAAGVRLAPCELCAAEVLAERLTVVSYAGEVTVVCRECRNRIAFNRRRHNRVRLDPKRWSHE